MRVEVQAALVAYKEHGRYEAVHDVVIALVREVDDHIQAVVPVRDGEVGARVATQEGSVRILARVSTIQPKFSQARRSGKSLLPRDERGLDAPEGRLHLHVQVRVQPGVAVGRGRARVHRAVGDAHLGRVHDVLSHCGGIEVAGEATASEQDEAGGAAPTACFARAARHLARSC